MKLRNINRSFVYEISYCLLIIAAVFDMKLINIVLGLLGLQFFLDFKVTKKQVIPQLKNPVFIFLIIFVLYLYAHGFLYGSLEGRRFKLLFLIPSVVLLSLKVKDWTRPIQTFIVSTSLLVLCGIFNILNRYLIYGVFDMSNGDLIDRLLIVPRPYLGFTLLLSVILIGYLYQRTRMFKYLSIALAIFNSAYIFVISARISALTLVFITLLYLLFYANIKWSTKLVWGSLFLMSIGSLVLFNKGFVERMVFLQKLDLKSSDIKNYEPRAMIWECALGVAQKPDFNPLFGLSSTKELENQLVACYASDTENFDRRDYFVQSRFNTHNQFFDFYLTSGVVGLALFFILLASFLKGTITHYSAIALFVSILFFLVVENVLYVQRGVYLFSIVTVLFIVFQNDQRLWKGEYASKKPELQDNL